MALLQQLSQQEAHLEAGGLTVSYTSDFSRQPSQERGYLGSVLQSFTELGLYSPRLLFDKATRDIDLGGFIEEILNQ